MSEEATVSAAIGLLGALIGALAALSASWLQNRHDAKLRERERLMNLRRDVYLEAAEAIAGAPPYLVGIANANVAVESLAPILNSRPGWQTKLHAVASLETISAFCEADILIFSTALEMAPRRTRVDELARLAAEEQEKRGQIAQFQAALQSALQIQVPHLPPAQAIAAAEAIRLNVERAQADVAASHEREAAIHEERASLVVQLVELSVSRVAQHRILVARAVTAIRRELDMVVDEGAYLALMERTNQQFFAAFSPVIDQLKVLTNIAPANEAPHRAADAAGGL